MAGRNYQPKPAPKVYQSPGFNASSNLARLQKESAQHDKILTSGKEVTSDELPRRPAYGTKGKPVVLWANYFALTVKSDTSVHKYAVQVKRASQTPAAVAQTGTSSADVAKPIVRRIIQIYIEKTLGQTIDAVSDLTGTILSRQRIPDELLDVNVQYMAEGLDTPEDDAKSYRLVLSYNGSLTLSSVIDQITSTKFNTLLSQHQDLLSALNIIVGWQPKHTENTYTIGKNRHVSYSNTSDRVSLGQGIEALRGFVYSVRAVTERLLVNVQIKNMPFFKTGQLLNLLGDIGYSSSRWREADRFIQGLRVELVHLRRQVRGKTVYRYKTIVGFAKRNDGASLSGTNRPQVEFDAADVKRVKFWRIEDPKSKTATVTGAGKKAKGSAPVNKDAGATDAGKWVTVFAHFRERYPTLNIDNNSFPAINVGTPGMPSYVPIQTCVIRPGQVATRKMTPTHTANMIRYAVRPPSDNATSITTTGFQVLGLSEDNQKLRNFGLDVQPQLITVVGRVLTTPALSYRTSPGSNGRFTPARASWNLTKQKFLRGATLKNWKVVLLTGQGRRVNQEEVTTSVTEFTSQLRAHGMQVEPPKSITKHDANTKDEITSTFKILFAGPEGKEFPRPEFFLVVLPENNATLYSFVKYALDVHAGAISQCVVANKFCKNNPQTFGNIALKVNLKLGGANHSLESVGFGGIKFSETMFVGLDVTHPAPGAPTSSPSVVGIVASIGGLLDQWPASMLVQQGRVEMVSQLEMLFKGRLEVWQKYNKTLPKNIIVYRDGVSEGQYATILDIELPQFKAAIASKYPANNRPKLSIIVVGKRHHTRFYPTNTNDMDNKTGNPEPGTIVDRGVTAVCNWDFFLQSHAALQGTAKPAHYYVVYDELLRQGGQDKAANMLEEMTHHLCYLFGRATKAVSVCPPAYYADLVCDRARCYLVALADAATGQILLPANGLGVRQDPETIKHKMFYI